MCKARSKMQKKYLDQIVEPFKISHCDNASARRRSKRCSQTQILQSITATTNITSQMINQILLLNHLKLILLMN